jgi:hypothetical protein
VVGGRLAQLALAGAPAGESMNPGRLDVFVRGTDNVMWHIWNLG